MDQFFAQPPEPDGAMHYADVETIKGTNISVGRGH